MKKEKKHSGGLGLPKILVRMSKPNFIRFGCNQFLRTSGTFETPLGPLSPPDSADGYKKQCRRHAASAAAAFEWT
jgi:hypothetical protein